jgi:hypothetical protein
MMEGELKDQWHKLICSRFICFRKVWIVTHQLQEPCEKVLLFLYAASHPLQDLRRIKLGFLKGIKFL